ncbi:MAG: ATP-dependent RecD-like DNA helicase [Christensenellales bacterium]
MDIVGTVNSVVFRNNENGYSIIKLNTAEGELVTSGKFPIVGEGEELSLHGEMILHPKYGKQFKANYVKIKKPTSAEQIIKYLSSGLISGVGLVTATNIVSMFQDKTLDIIENEPLTLAKVKGVSKEKALNIALRYNEIKKLQDAVIFLQNFDVSTNLAVKIYEKYKNSTERILNTNPYKLVEDIDGIGFKTADKIAIKMGIEPDSTFRMRAGLVYTLKMVAERTGSTLINKESLFNEVGVLLGFDMVRKEEVFEQCIANLIIDGYIKEYVEDHTVYYALAKFYNMEKHIANKLNMLLNNICNNKSIDFEIEMYEHINNIKLHTQQKEAVKMAVNNGVCIITGGPGTGKTTIIKAINFVLKKIGLKTLLLAPTGRASKRLSDATGEEAKTIHRALDINFKGPEFNSAFNTVTELEQDAVIVDEFSMVDTFVMYNLVNALSPNMRFIMVGDKDQLPSVGAGNVLDDLINCGKIPVVFLSQIYRQAEESSIVINAHRINNGEMVKYDNRSGDFFVLDRENQEENVELVISLVKNRLTSYLGIDSSNVQVIAPMKSGLLGVENLNKCLQNALNPKAENKTEITFSGTIFRVGDRVMQTINNYNQEWMKGAESGNGVFNGDVGIIEEINPSTMETTILFEDGRRAFYSIGELDELMLSYAITIHKSQGSEFDAVVIPLTGGNPAMLNRNLLYTAVTRAKKMVVIVSSNKQVYAMIKNNFSNHRLTLLKQLINNCNLEL